MNRLPGQLWILLCFVLLTGCIDFGGGKQAELNAAKSEIAEIKAEIAELEAEEKRLKEERSAKKEIVGNAPKEDHSEPENSPEKEAYVNLLTEKVNEVDAQLSEWKPAVRKSMQGRNFSGLLLASGESLDVVIDVIEDEFLQVKVDGETKQFDWNEIDPKSRRMLVHEETIAVEANDF